jgi:amino acid adenylation domain-containing protein
VKTTAFLAEMRGMGVVLRCDGAKLRCSAAKNVLTPALREEITRRKTEILAILGEEEPAARPLDRAPLRPMARLSEVPLSFAQQRQWFMNQLEPGSSAYVIAARRLLAGPLDLTAVEMAVSELVRRHESLRTSFPSIDGEPVQRIARPAPITLEVVDLENLPAADRDQLAEDTAREMAQRPFDLARGPLFRPVLLRHRQDEHELILSLHHIVADGWSFGIIARELGLLYEAYVAGNPSPLPDLPLQYADFAVWQRQWLTEEGLQDELHYWRAQLRGRPAPLEIPTDYDRPSRQSFAGGSHDFVLPLALADSLRELSHRAGTTLFMTLLAGFQALLSRYTGEEDILLGTPVANRTHLELEPIVGLFANTLVLRTNLAGDPTFRESLGRVRETCLGAYAHQNIPFESLVKELQPERRPGRNPLFEISFVFQGPSTGSTVRFVTVAAPFDLTLFVRGGSAGELRATIEYKSGLFAHDTIARMARHYRTLMEEVAANPDCRLSALPLLDDAERHRLLVELNATATDYPRERSLHSLFRDQVRATPDAVALVFEDRSLSYRELDRRANRVAQDLRRLGIGPEKPVGLWMERSIEMTVALLGILKAGGAYVPLDPQATPERLRFMLEDAKITVLLTQERLHPYLPPHEARVICLDGRSSPKALSKTGPQDCVTAETLACVIYGLASEPTSVALTHRNLVQLARSAEQAQFRPGEVFLQLAPLSFNASLFEVWAALLSGSRLVIAPPEALAAEELGGLVARYGVTVLWLTPGLFHQLVEHCIEMLHPLRRILISGECLSASCVERFLAKFPECRLVKLYGPTEATAVACCQAIPADARYQRASPIGRPVSNTRLYVLDGSFDPVPIGVPGELWLAGDGLARGYLNRPDLTAERFVIRRFSPLLEERLYRSGDIVRRLGDDTLEFIARRDEDVRIRGYRVAPGEIEAALARHPGIREVAVVARPGPEGDQQLAAYIEGDASCAARDLRDFLRRRLPDYMLPATFIALGRMPLTPDGRVDRRMLADRTDCGEQAAAVGAPRNAMERRLVRIWEEVLPVRPIGMQDSFFDLGGHSLMAVRLFARLEEAIGVRLPLSTLFETPTIEGLAAIIQRGGDSRSWRSLVAINPAGKGLPIFAVPGVGGNVLCYSDLARLLGPERPFYALQSRGLSGSERPLTRIEDIAAAFLAEIREMQPRGPYQLLGTCIGGIVAYEMAQQLRAAGQEVKPLLLIEAWPPPPKPTRRLRAGARPRAALHIIANRLRLYVTTFAALHGRQRLDYVKERLNLLRQMMAQRDVFRGDRTEFYLESVTQANQDAFEHYQPGLYAGRAVLFYATERDVAPSDDRRLTWHELITGELDVRPMPGADSGLMLVEPHVRPLAQQIIGCIDSPQSSVRLLERA